MPSGGQSGHTTTLSGASMGSVGEITAIGHPGLEVTMIDITTMTSTNGWREFTDGLKDAGEISVEVFYTKAQTTTVLAALAGASEVWTIGFPDGGAWACSGIISGLSGATPMDDGITQTLTIKLTGEPSFTT